MLDWCVNNELVPELEANLERFNFLVLRSARERLRCVVPIEPLWEGRCVALLNFSGDRILIAVRDLESISERMISPHALIRWDWIGSWYLVRKHF